LSRDRFALLKKWGSPSFPKESQRSTKRVAFHLFVLKNEDVKPKFYFPRRIYISRFFLKQDMFSHSGQRTSQGDAIFWCIHIHIPIQCRRLIEDIYIRNNGQL